MPLFGGCFSGRKKKRRKLKISPPLHLLVKGDVAAQCHAFKNKLFRRKRACSVCHQPINAQGSSCRVCEYACHKSCEPKASVGCTEADRGGTLLQGSRSRDPTPERYHGNQSLQIYRAVRGTPPTKRKHPETAAQQNDPVAKPRPAPAKQSPQGRPTARRRSRERAASMELNFVTQRVIALCFPPGITTATYRDNLREVAQMLQTKHGDNYMIFNLSERRQDLCDLSRQVTEYGWPETLAPPLDKLCSICKVIDSWISAGPQNIAVLHSRAGKHDRGGWQRIGVVVSAYIHYSNICRSPDQALDRFAMKKFFDDKIRHLEHPSQKRYVNYFAGLLSGLIQINSSPLSLHHVVLVGSPQMGATGGCRAFVRVYQGMVPLWTSGLYTVPDRCKYTVISPECALQLRGDILIKCYHCDSTSVRQVVFRVQFHTCAVTDPILSFARQDLDDACDDMRFPLDGGVELHFAHSTLGQDQVAAATQPEHTPHPLKRWDSYEQFFSAGDEPDADAVETLAHTEGPLDGSLYATVIKKPSVSTSAPVTSSRCAVVQCVATSSAAEQNELHTVSMDSGISSGGRERLSGGSSHSPHSAPHSGSSAQSAPVPCDTGDLSPATRGQVSASSPAPVHQTVAPPRAPVRKQSSVDVTQLDELLSGMLEYCSTIPDLRPCQTPAPDIDTIRAPVFDLPAPPPPSSSVSPLVGVSGAASPQAASRTAVSGHSVHHTSLGDTSACNLSSSSGYQSQQSPNQPPVPPPRNMVHYNGYKPDSSYTETYSMKASTEQRRAEIPYHARTDSKPFSYANFSGANPRESVSPVGSPKLGRKKSPDLESPRMVDSLQQQRQQLESPRLVRKLLVSVAQQSVPTTSTSKLTTSATPPSPSLPRKTYTNGGPPVGNASSGFKEVRTTTTTTKTYNNGDTLKSNKSYNTDTLPSQRSYKTDTMKSGYNTDTLRSTTSYNTDTLKSNKSYDWQDTIRSTKESPQATTSRGYDWESTVRSTSKEPTPGRALEPYRRPPANNLDIDLNDPNVKTVTTYDQNTNSMTTVSTQSFDVPCSPNPTRKIVETTKRYVVDDEKGKPTGVTKLEETIREFTIEDLPDGEMPQAGNVTWLQKQQQKLRDRQQARIRSERAPHEARVLRELRQRHGHEDGYTSDTTLWTDTSREPSPAKYAPLHVNTAANKGSSAPVSPHLATRSASTERTTYRYQQQSSQPQTRPVTVTRHRSETAYDRQRPQVQVKRTDQRKVSDSDLTNLISVTQDSQFASTPVHDRYGLLTVVNGQSGPDDEIDALIVSDRPDSPWKYKGSGVWVRDPPEPRPETPAFPNPPKTPYVNQTLPPKSPTTQRKLLTITQTTKKYTRAPSDGPVTGRERSPSPAGQQVHVETTTSFESSPSVYQTAGRHSRQSSVSSDTEVITAHPFFVKDISKWWYKPDISREHAISILKDKAPGTFVIRDSNSFPGAFGLALKVATPPAGVQSRGGDVTNELVRHFLIETTSRGVRLKGCPNEPTFGSLSALVYQHSVTPLALPCKLTLPEADPAGLGSGTDTIDRAHAQHKHSSLLESGAACSVLYLHSGDIEALTGPQAVRRATTQLFRLQPPPEPTVVHFKVSNQGITLTDSQRKQFFRRHYNTAQVSHCSMDPEDRRWTLRSDDGQPTGSLRIFGFVAKKGPSSGGNNQCHLFAEYDPDQPASAIVNFVTNVMMTTYGTRSNML